MCGAHPIGYLVARPAVDSVGVGPNFLSRVAGLTLVASGTMLLPSPRLLGGLPDTPPEETDDGRMITGWAHWREDSR